MLNTKHLIFCTAAVVVAAAVVACAPVPVQNAYPASYPQTKQGAYPAGSYPATANPSQNQQGALVEYGRVSSIEVVQTPAQTQGSGVGALIGGVAGAAVGRQIGGGSGRDAATAVGALAGRQIGGGSGRDAATVVGALAGNAVEKSRNSALSQSQRVFVQLDSGGVRSYDVLATGQFRVGDRVRVENNQLARW